MSVNLKKVYNQKYIHALQKKITKTSYLNRKSYRFDYPIGHLPFQDCVQAAGGRYIVGATLLLARAVSTGRAR